MDNLSNLFVLQCSDGFAIEFLPTFGKYMVSFEATSYAKLTKIFQALYCLLFGQIMKQRGDDKFKQY